MKVTHLPILSRDSSLNDAVRAMRVQQRSAVVREEPTKVQLVKIARICTALAQHQSKLSNVNITQPIHRPTPGEINHWHLDTKDPDNSHSNWQNFLDDQGHTYALVDSFLGTAMIVTRNEPKADEIEAKPQKCYCEGPDEHAIPPNTMSGQICGVCSTHVNCL